MKKKLLFVCIENSNRSQMAEAFARLHGADKVDVFSAGSSPSGKINPKAIDSMREVGYDLSTHHSKNTKEVETFSPFDLVVTMGCGDSCPLITAKKIADWKIPEPKEMTPIEFAAVRDLIEARVLELLKTL